MDAEERIRKLERENEFLQRQVQRYREILAHEADVTEAHYAGYKKPAPSRKKYMELQVKRMRFEALEPTRGYLDVNTRISFKLLNESNTTGSVP